MLGLTPEESKEALMIAAFTGLLVFLTTLLGVAGRKHITEGIN